MGQINVLYILQQSIYDNTGKWLTADSNINMMVGIVDQLVRFNKDLHFYVLIDKLEHFKDLVSYTDLINHPQVHWVPYPFVVDAFLNRQNFNVDEFDKVMQNLPEIHIVWSNITEQSRNIKTYLHYKKMPAKLITCCYWLDTPMIGEPKVPQEIAYMWRQFDGMECSDICVFTCRSTFEAFFANAIKVFDESFIKKIAKKSTIWDFGFSATEASSFHVDRRETDKPIILFLNRLSDINYTHHHEFISAVNQLWQKRQDFEVVFTNPSQKADWEGLKKLVEPLKVINNGQPLNRQQYFELLWKSAISFHGYTLERYGGCAHRESIYCQNLVVTPKVFEYANIQGKKYPFYVKNDFSDLTEVLDRALNKLYFIKGTRWSEIRTRNNQSAFEYVAGKVASDIERALKITIRVF